MPVTKSAKKALRTAERRHEENLMQRDLFKKAIKAVKKAASTGEKEVASLFSQAQSTLDRAAKKHTIHPNKAARLKSRLSKKMSLKVVTKTEKPVTKKTTVKKPANKKKK